MARSGIWRRVVGFAGLLILSGLLSAQPAEVDETQQLTIDTPILRLLENEKARAAVAQFLPGLMRAMDEDYNAMEFLGSSSLRELSIDDDHVIGFDEALLEKLTVALAAAQE